MSERIICEVAGCENTAANEGTSWRDTGTWMTCSTHLMGYLRGENQPEMKIEAVEREKLRIVEK